MRYLSALVLLASGLFAQTTTPPFGLRFQQGTNVSILSDGAQVPFSADGVGLSVSGNLAVTYRGVVGTTVTINSIDLTGSLDFAITGATPPFNMAGNETVTLGIRYSASTPNRTTARVVVNYTENRVTNSFSLNLVGTAPDFAFSYIPAGGNTQPLVSGTTIRFPETAVDATANATLIVTNRGSGSGPIPSMSATGAAFQLVGAPLPGTIVDSGRDVRVGIAFTPKQVAPSTGTVTVELPDRRVTFNLEGTGSAAEFTYEIVSDNGSAAVLRPDGSVSLPDTNVNEKSTIQIRVRNTGTADGRVTAVSGSGTALTIGDVPPLPVLLTPGSRFTFSITFAPTTPGRVAGRLRIGLDQFDITANALGPVLSYAYIVGGVSSTILNSGSVNFVPTSVGTTTTVQFQVSNTGTAQGSFTSVSVVSAGTVFDVSSVAPLPITLGPGASSTFNVTFAPTAIGAASGTLRVDAQTFTLTGTGTNPAPLPSYRFEGSAGTLDPLAQPAVSLTLANPYPLNLSGTLTLAFNSDVFSNDPSVQFAPGGRTVNFIIPANTTRALFANNATSIRLQTGTVAGILSLSPTFATDGGINLTPTRPDTLSLTVAPAAPKLLNVNISAKSSTSITLLISGYATSRSITQVDLTFTPISGENVTTKSLSLNVESAFLAWYSGTPSQAFGSLFTATLPLNFAGDTTLDATPSMVDAIQSIGLTISNRTGRSETRSVDVR